MASRRKRVAEPADATPDEGAPDAEEERGARSFWSGTISFGLVSVPVALFPATRPSGGSLRMLAPDGTPLERRWYCPTDEHDVPWAELTRGYEMDDGSYVELTDEELEAAAPEKSRDIDLRVFVPRESLDPVFFEHPYYLTPAGESTKAYRLLVAAMERTGFAGIATFVMRTKEYLIAIVADDGLLRAETLRWAGEVRTPKDVGLRKSSQVKAATVKAIEKAIDGLAADAIDESELADTRPRSSRRSWRRS
jgi:DNA end-binding protein Ku